MAWGHQIKDKTGVLPHLSPDKLQCQKFKGQPAGVRQEVNTGSKYAGVFRRASKVQVGNQPAAATSDKLLHGANIEMERLANMYTCTDIPDAPIPVRANARQASSPGSPLPCQSGSQPLT